ncbi:MAG TPA: glycosyltransferase, partial [Dokdonella sp.]|nr:glycosyltransferase [Dokdonella sp.]
MSVSVVVETWNIAGDPEVLGKLLATLAPQLAAAEAELVITHAGIAADARERLAAIAARDVRWLELPAGAGYYEHKNAGFDATTGDVVAFIDGDCDPVSDWLAELTAPFAAGARVVAGATSYAGLLAPLANELDFPYFDVRRRPFGALAAAPKAVLNFFANNVAFARDVFAARHYPTIEPMFHGQCQVLALQLAEDGIPIAFALGALVVHAWPEGATEWLQVRLLRGADTTRLLPYVLRTHAPRARGIAERLGPLPALAVLGARAVTATWSALRRGPALRGLALVA